jgi:hypothetical protein
MSKLSEIQKVLVDITKGCRSDMHEPGEQGLYGEVYGKSLDNACCPRLKTSRTKVLEYAETCDLFVSLVRGRRTVNVNLCDLINLARHADPKLLEGLEYPWLKGKSTATMD